MMKRLWSIWGIFFLLVVISGCEQNTGIEKQQETTTAVTPRTESENITELVEEYFKRSLPLKPVFATRIGEHQWDDQFPNAISLEYLEKAEALEREFLERVNTIDKGSLQGQDLLTWEIFKSKRENALEGFKYPSWLIPVNQFFSPHNVFAQMGSGKSFHPFETVKNYDDFIGRMEGFSVWVDQAIHNMRDGIARGYVSPKILMQRVLPQLETHIVEDADKSLFYRPVKNIPDSFSETDHDRLTAAYRKTIMETVIPAYQRLHDFIEKEYLHLCRDSVGLSRLPDGEAWYAYLVKTHTTTDLTPEQIHQIGLDEVKRIHGEMRDVMTEVGFEGDLKQFFEFLKTEPEFFYSEREDLINGYRALRERVHSLAPKLFARFPKSDYEIRAVEPFREKSSAGGYYQPSAPDGSRPGIFYANAYDLKSRPKWGMESLFLHEAVPGHHFQVALQQEVESLPRVRRFGRYTAYGEGWGLYAESLGREMGMYTDPYQYYGKLSAELWRAVRLVVDTGIHAKGWSRQQVLDYMYENTAAGKASAVAEAERYMAIPGQALAYKIGQLKIRELRDRAEAVLGGNFDPRDFHEVILLDGSLPLNVLESKVNRWLETEKG